MLPESGHQPISASRLAVARAETYLRKRLDTPIGVSELSRVVGTSERGLRRAFQTVLGTSPKRYMLTERLGAVRRDLRDATNPATSVTDVAGRHGFSELGRFAGSYRKVFGETPSDTLRRARRRDKRNHHVGTSHARLD
jgi:AraC family ethanolamine operon transcriptional activator